MIRSASALWLFLHRTRVPPGATWGSLCQGKGFAHLLDAVRDKPLGSRKRTDTFHGVHLIREKTTAFTQIISDYIPQQPI